MLPRAMSPGRSAVSTFPSIKPALPCKEPGGGAAEGESGAAASLCPLGSYVLVLVAVPGRLRACGRADGQRHPEAAWKRRVSGPQLT